MKLSDGTAKKAIMPSSQSPELEIFFLSGEEPFVCGANGHITIAMLTEIEQDCCENVTDMFDQGDGSYLFSMHFNDAQRGDEGRIEIQAYWEFDLICFAPISGQRNSEVG